MALFFNQKPRSFHHEYIYVDERKEFLEKLKGKHNKKKTRLDTNTASPDKDLPSFESSNSYQEEMAERVRENFRTGNHHLKSTHFLRIMPMGMMALLLIVLLLAIYFCFS